MLALFFSVSKTTSQSLKLSTVLVIRRRFDNVSRKFPVWFNPVDDAGYRGVVCSCAHKTGSDACPVKKQEM